jgi:hypothetical protein
MLLIRKPQLEALGARHRSAFAARLGEHLGRFFPERCRVLGPEGVAEAIEHGITRAALYGLTSERDVCKYIDLMFVFGRDFDRAECQPWAARILARRATTPPGALVEALLDKAMRMMHRAYGIAGAEGPP